MIVTDPILDAALQAGIGKPIVRMFRCNPPAANKIGDYYYPVKYSSSRFQLSAWFNDWKKVSASDYLRPAYACILERGLEIGGVEYTVNSPFWYPLQSFEDSVNFNSRVDFLAWNTSNYDETTDADIAAHEVIENLMSVGCTASFLGQAWEGHQFDKNGANLHMTSFTGLIPMLWNRYTVRMFPRQNGIMQFKSKILGNEETMEAARPWMEVGKYQMNSRVYQTTVSGVPGIWNTWEHQNWNLFWEDELGVTHRLSATYPALLVYKLRNIGFQPSTASMAYLKTLLSDTVVMNSVTGASQTPRMLEYIIRPDLALEQGEWLATADGANYPIIARITEEYNVGGTKYPWQMRVQGEDMFYVV